VAKVNAVTRLALGIPEGLATGLAIWLVFRALYARLPKVPEETTFWELVRLREARGAPETPSKDEVADGQADDRSAHREK
jgi:hypothetical protein